MKELTYAEAMQLLESTEEKIGPKLLESIRAAIRKGPNDTDTWQSSSYRWSDSNC